MLEKMNLKFFLENLFNFKVDVVIEEIVKPRLKQYSLENVEYPKGL